MSFEATFLVAAGAALAVCWVGFLLSGSVLIGGSVFKPVWVKRRERPVAYVTCMLLLGAVAAFVLSKGVAGVGRL